MSRQPGREWTSLAALCAQGPLGGGKSWVTEGQRRGRRARPRGPGTPLEPWLALGACRRAGRLQCSLPSFPRISEQNVYKDEIHRVRNPPFQSKQFGAFRGIRNVGQLPPLIPEGSIAPPPLPPDTQNPLPVCACAWTVPVNRATRHVALCVRRLTGRHVSRSVHVVTSVSACPITAQRHAPCGRAVCASIPR